MKVIRTSLFAMLTLLTVECATVPITGRKQFNIMPSSEMLYLGATTYDSVINESRLSRNNSYTDMVKEVGTRISSAVTDYFTRQNMSNLLQGYKWEFNVIQSDEQNAWCLPGGKIAFYEGIMPVCQDANGVATVMSHEVAHAIANHGSERLSQQLAVQLGGVALDVALSNEPDMTRQLADLAFGVGSTLGVILPYSRKHESEADELGLYFMAMAGYNPQTAIQFWERMAEAGAANPAPPEFLSTHPVPLRTPDIPSGAKGLQFCGST
jgi:predicted Zn-dependent protease